VAADRCFRLRPLAFARTQGIPGCCEPQWGMQVSWISGDSLVLAITGLSPLSLAFVPLAAAMVYADRLIMRWADENDRIYSIRDLLIVEATLMALLCLFFWFLRACGGQVRVMTAVWPAVLLTALRAGWAFWMRWGRGKRTQGK
jgi:hypothetical protein